MNEFEQAIAARFGKDNVKGIVSPAVEIPLLQVNIDRRSKITVLMTNGLSDYTMPVPEKFSGKEHLELYFCLPSYWDFENPNGQWIFEWMQKLTKHVVEKQTWFGIGHTIPNGNPAAPLSTTMMQKYLLLSEPMLLKEELKSIQVNGREISFLGIIPIFEDEMDYKMAKGTYKLMQKMEGKGISELLDDFRLSSLKSKWRVLKR